MWADLIVNLITLAALVGYIEFRLRDHGALFKESLLKRFGEQLNRITTATIERIGREAEQFACYYCGRLFPAAECERIGEYQYCKEHGSARKSLHLGKYQKPEEPDDDNRVGIHTADSRGQQSDHNKFPWLS